MIVGMIRMTRVLKKMKLGKLKKWYIILHLFFPNMSMLLALIVLILSSVIRFGAVDQAEDVRLEKTNMAILLINSS